MRYKLIFGDAFWQNRSFISLTRTKDDGTSHVLHVVMGQQITFGSYYNKEEKAIEFKYSQTWAMTEDMGEKYANEEAFSKLLGVNILEVLLSDKAFLERVEAKARRDNHRALIGAALDLKKGICRGEIIAVQFPFDYRAYVMNLYFQYILSCNQLKINAHPSGDFIEIQANLFPGFFTQRTDQNLSINLVAAQTVHDKVCTIVKDTYPGYPIIHQILFLGQPITGKMNLPRCYEEITNPTLIQIGIVDSLFDYADQLGFFPTNPQALIRSKWEENCQFLTAASPRISTNPFIFQPATKVSSDEEHKGTLVKKAAL